MSYSRKIHEKMSGISDVGFRPFGHAGVRIRCSMKESAYHYRSVEFAITMAARENFLYYPLFLLGDFKDRLAAWCFLKTRTAFSLEVIPVHDRRNIRRMEGSPYLEALTIRSDAYRGFRAYTNNPAQGERLLSEAEFCGGFERLRSLIKRFSVDQTDSKIHVLSNLTMGNVEDILKFVLAAGKASASLTK